jgi:hypothetical protein
MAAWNRLDLTWHNFIEILYTRLFHNLTYATLAYILMFVQHFYFYVMLIRVVGVIGSLYEWLNFITDSNVIQNI